MIYIKPEADKYVTFSALPIICKCKYIIQCKDEFYTDDFLKAFASYCDLMNYEHSNDVRIILERLEKFSLLRDWYFNYEPEKYGDYLTAINLRKIKTSGLKLDFDENCVYISSVGEGVVIIE